MGYKEMKVFELVDGWSSAFPPYVATFTCRGVANDEMREWHPSIRKLSAIKSGRLLYEGKKPQGGAHLTRCIDKETCKATSWFLTSSEADDAAKRMGIKPVDTIFGVPVFCRQTSILKADEIERCPKVFEVYFEEGPDGRLSARYNIHPEVDGTNARGKLLFPDKAFSGVDVGYAKVSVAREFDGYAFVTGEMEKKTAPDLKKVLDWAWDKQMDESVLFIINHPSRGLYYSILEKNGLFNVGENEDGEVYKALCPNEIAEHDAKRYVERAVTFSVLFAEEAWGADVSVYEIRELFKESSFFCDGVGQHRGRWIRSDMYHGELIEKAIEAGVLTGYREDRSGIEILSMAADQFSALYALPLEEVKQLAAEVSAVNEKADTTAVRFAESGKLK